MTGKKKTDDVEPDVVGMTPFEEPATVVVHDYDPVRPRRRKASPPQPEPWPEHRPDPDGVFDDDGEAGE